MTKYYVNDTKGNQVYAGFDEGDALKTWHGYNENVDGDYYIDELDFEEPEEEDENTWVFWEHDYLTCLYGDDEGIKEDMKMAIEYLTGRKIIDFELDYNDPGDSGDDATFWAHNIKWEHTTKYVKDCTINEIFNYILKKVGPGADITEIRLTAAQGVSVYCTTKRGKPRQFHLGPNKKIEIEEE